MRNVLSLNKLTNDMREAEQFIAKMNPNAINCEGYIFNYMVYNASQGFCSITLKIPNEYSVEEIKSVVEKLTYFGYLVSYDLDHHIFIDWSDAAVKAGVH